MTLEHTSDCRANTPNDGKQKCHLDLNCVGSLKHLLFLLALSRCHRLLASLLTLLTLLSGRLVQVDTQGGFENGYHRVEYVQLGVGH